MKGKKMNIRKIITVALFCAAITGNMILAGCTEDNTETTETSSASSVASVVVSEEKVESTVSVEEEDTDASYSESDSTKITLSGKTASVEGEGAKADGGTITISKAGTYVLSGTLDDGQVVIEAGKNDTVKLILNNASITSSTAPAIYASKCEKTILVLEKGTTNTLADGKDYVKEDTTETSTTSESSATEEDESSDNPNAAVYVKDDLTILGEGTLNVTGNAKNGITSKDVLRITSGTINVKAAHHGITGKDNLYISGGTVTVEAADGDGMRSTYSKTDDADKGHVYIEGGEINITSANDGIQSEKNLVINGGTITVKAGGGAPETITNNSNDQGGRGGFMQNNNASSDTDTESTKGIKAGADLTIGGGTITIDSGDDGVHSNGNVTVTDGTITVKSGDDGVHADTNLVVKNGTVTIEKSYEGLEGENIDISGGTIDVTASDDGINCNGGNDSSGFGGMDGNMQFGHGGRMQDGQNMPTDQNQNTANAQATAATTEKTEDSTDTTQKSDNTQTGILSISGGTVYVNAQGDGVDSNGELNVSGGTVIVNGTTSGGNGILDHDGSCTFTGGTVIGAGTSDMLEMPSESSTQNTLAVLFDQTQTAGTLVYVIDSSGNVLAAMSPEKNFGCFILSSAELKNGETYNVYVGGTATGDSVHGHYSKASVSGGTQYTSFTLSDSKVTYVNASGVTTYSGGMGGGMKGDMGNFNNGSDNIQQPNGDNNAQMPQMPNGDNNTQNNQNNSSSGNSSDSKTNNNIQTPNNNNNNSNNAQTPQTPNSDNNNGQMPQMPNGGGRGQGMQRPDGSSNGQMPQLPNNNNSNQSDNSKKSTGSTTNENAAASNGQSV